MIDIMKLRKLEKEQKEKSSQKEEVEKPKPKRKTTRKTKAKVKKEPETKVEEKIEYEVVEDIDIKIEDEPKKEVEESVKQESINKVEKSEEDSDVNEETEQVKEDEEDKAQALRDQLMKELLADDSFGSRTDNADSEETEAEVEMVEAQEVEEPETIKDEVKEDAPLAEDKLIEEKEVAKEEIKTVPLSDIPIQKDDPDKYDDLRAKENIQVKEAEENIELENIVQVIGFIIGKECYGIEIKDIQEIIRMVDITKVPNVPNFIEGVINLRGKVLPVVNLRTKVDMEKKEFNSKTRIIVLEKDNTSLGFIVDEIKEVIRIPDNQLEPPPEIAVGSTTDYIKSVAKVDDGMVILLDSSKLLERTHT